MVDYQFLLVLEKELEKEMILLREMLESGIINYGKEFNESMEMEDGI